MQLKQAVENAKGQLDGVASLSVPVLNAELGKESGTKESDKYQNADQAKRTAYDQALAAAKAVAAKEGASQAEVEKAKNDLVAAAAALNGQRDRQRAITNSRNNRCDSYQRDS